MALVADWLMEPKHGRWLLVIDNADDMRLFYNQEPDVASASVLRTSKGSAIYLPECAHGYILITTRNKQVGLRLAKGQPPIEVGAMTEAESKRLLATGLKGLSTDPQELSRLSSELQHLPLALTQSTSFIHETSITVGKYLDLIDKYDSTTVELLSREFETVGRDSQTPRAVAQTWILSFQQIEQQNNLAGILLVTKGMM